jgi:hypothetical protein
MPRRQASRPVGGGSLTAAEATETVAPRAGFDTISLAWRGDAIAGDPLRALAGSKGLAPVRGRPGELRPAERLAPFVTVGYYPAAGETAPSARTGRRRRETGLLYVEGRLGAIVDGDVDVHRLADARELRDGVERVLELVAPSGLELDRERCELRRLDAVTERRHEDDPREGLAELAALAALDPPRMKVEVVRLRRRIQTVYYRHEGSFAVHLRAYCKATETGHGEPGSWIRVEQQNRPRAGRRQSVAQLRAEGRELGRLFGHRIEAYERAGLVEVGSTAWAERRVAQLLAAGDLTPRVAERLWGTVSVWRQYGPEWGGWSTRTRQRRRAELRELGLVVGDTIGRTRPVTVHLGELVRDLRSPWVDRRRDRRRLQLAA